MAVNGAGTHKGQMAQMAAFMFCELLFDLDNMRRCAAFQTEKPDYLVTQDENSFHDLS